MSKTAVQETASKKQMQTSFEPLNNQAGNAYKEREDLVIRRIQDRERQRILKLKELRERKLPCEPGILKKFYVNLRRDVDEEEEEENLGDPFSGHVIDCREEAAIADGEDLSSADRSTDGEESSDDDSIQEQNDAYNLDEDVNALIDLLPPTPPKLKSSRWVFTPESSPSKKHMDLLEEHNSSDPTSCEIAEGSVTRLQQPISPQSRPVVPAVSDTQTVQPGKKKHRNRSERQRSKMQHMQKNDVN